MNLALSGVRVIQLANFVAAPGAARYFADHGADVIIIESAQGDPLRYTGVNEGRPQDMYENTTWEYLNGNKRCVSLDMKNPEGKEAFFKLLSTADILITNWREQALMRAGLDYNSLKDRYPKLIYGMCTGYGVKGPDKDLPGYDMTAFLSRGGYIHVNRRAGGPPHPAIPGIGDNNVGLVLALNILTAYLRSQKTGKGDLVVSSLYENAIWNHSIMLMASQYDGYARTFPIGMYNNTNPLNGGYTTADDRIVQIAMPDYDQRFKHFCEAIGRQDLADCGKYWPQAEMVNNGHLHEFTDILLTYFKSKTWPEWKKILVEGDIPHALAYNWQEMLADPQAEAMGCYYDLTCLNGNVRRITRTPGYFESIQKPMPKAAPLIGENGPEILKELGYSDERISSMLAGGALYIWKPEK